jgi:cold shock CspA family protein
MATIETLTTQEENNTPLSPCREKYTGVVKWFDSRGGFGFITVLSKEGVKQGVSLGLREGKEIFVHYSALSTTLTGQYKYLVLGEYVEFELAKAENEKYEFYAKNVTGIFGGNLMCQSRKLFESGKKEQGEQGTNKEGEEGEQGTNKEANEVQSRESRFRKRPAPKYVYKKPRVSETGHNVNVNVKRARPVAETDKDGYKVVGKKGK